MPTVPPPARPSPTTAADSQAPLRLIDRRGSLRSRALARLRRLQFGEPLQQDTDIVALRQRYEALDGRDVQRTPVDCAWVPA